MIKKTDKRIDLHLHSTASDGLYTPSKLIELVSKRGLSAVALTDHETISGIGEAQEAGKKFGVEVIPGVEISVGLNGRELHILGYLPAISLELDSILFNLRKGRFERMEKMILNLKKMSISVRMEDIEKEAGKAAPGRLHLARLLQKKGYVLTIKEAFDRFLGRGKPAYIPRDKLKPEEAINFLLEAGAVPVLAHPGLTGEESTSLYKLKNEGLKGIEAIHPHHTEGLTLFYKNWALREGLLVTGGSDYHGDNEEACPYPGYVSLDYHYLNLIKKALISKNGI